VSNAAGYGERVSGQTFQDVPPTNPFYVWIERLASRGIMTGYPCGQVPNEPCMPQNKPYFRPSTFVSRGQTTKTVSNTFFPSCQTP
jgi:S-layer homology domain